MSPFDSRMLKVMFCMVVLPGDGKISYGLFAWPRSGGAMGVGPHSSATFSRVLCAASRKSIVGTDGNLATCSGVSVFRHGFYAANWLNNSTIG